MYMCIGLHVHSALTCLNNDIITSSLITCLHNVSITSDSKVPMKIKTCHLRSHNYRVIRIIMAHRAIPMIAFPRVRSMFIYIFIFLCHLREYALYT